MFLSKTNVRLLKTYIYLLIKNFTNYDYSLKVNSKSRIIPSEYLKLDHIEIK